MTQSRPQRLSLPKYRTRALLHPKILSSSCGKSRMTTARTYPPNSLTAGSHNLAPSVPASLTTASSGITP